MELQNSSTVNSEFNGNFNFSHFQITLLFLAQLLHRSESVWLNQSTRAAQFSFYLPPMRSELQELELSNLTI